MDLTGDEAEIARDDESLDEEEEEGSELDEEEVWKVCSNHRFIIFESS